MLRVKTGIKRKSIPAGKWRKPPRAERVRSSSAHTPIPIHPPHKKKEGAKKKAGKKKPAKKAAKKKPAKKKPKKKKRR